MDLTSLEAATERIREWEAAGAILNNELSAEPVTVEDAIACFMLDAKARNLAEATLKKYKVLLEPPSGVDPNRTRQRSPSLSEFASHNGVRYLSEVTTDLLRQFRACWRDRPLSGHKKLEV